MARQLSEYLPRCSAQVSENCRMLLCKPFSVKRCSWPRQGLDRASRMSKAHEKALQQGRSSDNNGLCFRKTVPDGALKHNQSIKRPFYSFFFRLQRAAVSGTGSPSYGLHSPAARV